MSSIKYILTQVGEWLNRQPEIRYALYFGSILSEQNFNAASDVDLAIAGTSKFEFEKILDWKTQLENIVGRAVDLIDLNAVTGAILQEALTKGNTLKIVDLNLKESLIKKMWYDQSDFQPLVKRMLAERRKKFYGQS